VQALLQGINFDVMLTTKVELKPFAHQGQEVRTVQINGQSFFVAKDVCDAIGIQNSRDALSRLDDDEVFVSEIPTGAGLRKTNLVNEVGLYHLLLKSTRPEAKPFRKWVTSVVLPALRKHGSYSTDAAQAPRASTGQLGLFPELPSTEHQRIQNLLVDVALQAKPGSKVAQLVRLVKTRLLTSTN
jgi:prophage antirepressor-like protein